MGDPRPEVGGRGERFDVAALIPHATLHIYPGGHVEPLTAATDFGPRITQFLTRPHP